MFKSFSRLKERIITYYDEEFTDEKFLNLILTITASAIAFSYPKLKESILTIPKTPFISILKFVIFLWFSIAMLIFHVFIIYTILRVVMTILSGEGNYQSLYKIPGPLFIGVICVVFFLYLSTYWYLGTSMYHVIIDYFKQLPLDRHYYDTL